MTLETFIANNNGKYVDVDGYYGAQCWDLVELYAEQVLGVPKEPWAITLGPEGAAKEAWTVFDSHLQKYFVKIPAGQQKKGDITVYGPHGIYTEGHIAIQGDNGLVFEQNADPDHSPAHISTRANTYLLGSLRRKGGDMASRDDLIALHRLAVGVDPGASFIAAFEGQPIINAINNLQGFSGHAVATKDGLNKLNKLATGADAGPLFISAFTNKNYTEAMANLLSYPGSFINKPIGVVNKAAVVDYINKNLT